MKAKALLVGVIITILFVGCSKFRTSKSSDEENKNPLVGTWNLKYNNGVSIDGESILKFMPNGTVESIEYGTDIESEKEGYKQFGLWTYCDDQLYAVFRTISDVNCSNFYSMEGAIHLGSNEFTWYRMVEGEKITLIYERK